MEIRERLKAARQEAGLTQEEAAARLGVSRQTVWNWENGRSYPDIVRTCDVSDLYGLSLDELVKGDVHMKEHLEQSTDTVRSRRFAVRSVAILVYLAIWAFLILLFWVGRALGALNPLGYGIVAQYLVLPITTIVVAAFLGYDDALGTNARWVALVLFGVGSMLVPYATFYVANMITFEVFRIPDIVALLPGFLCGAIGLGIGVLLRRRARKKQT